MASYKEEKKEDHIVDVIGDFYPHGTGKTVRYSWTWNVRKDFCQSYKYFYPSGKLEIVETYTGEQPNRGIHTAFFENGNLRREVALVNDKFSGKSIVYHLNGQKLEECEYVDGLKQGIYKTWHSNGMTWETCEYDKDRLVRVISVKDENCTECALEDGDLTVWKACKAGQTNVCVKILVVPEANRVTPVSNVDVFMRLKRSNGQKFKSRISTGKVLEIVDATGKHYTSCQSFIFTGKPLTYVHGETITADGFDNDANEDCVKGIHVNKYKMHCMDWFK